LECVDVRDVLKIGVTPDMAAHTLALYRPPEQLELEYVLIGDFAGAL